jgi:hypothetical protein
MIALAIASAVQMFESAVSGAPAQVSVPLADIVRQLAGTWKAAQDRTPRDTRLDEEVFGSRAFGVRNVTLSIRRRGDGTLRVHTAIVGRNGHVFVPTLIEVQFRLGEPAIASTAAVVPTVTVISAVKRELDEPHERWPLEDVRVDISLPDRTGRELNLQFDTKDGRDGFGVTLDRRD